MFVGRKAAGVVLAVCAALTGCGDGLGECDPTKLGGNMTPGMVMPFEGQRIVAERCASGRCHSASAVGDQRFGAPADLNFDVLAGDRAQLAKALGIVVDWSEDIWDEIEGETMPPEKPAGSGPLSSAEQEAVRNWLACGADGIAPEITTAATWESIWTTLSPNCLGCHSSGAGGSSGGGFVLGDDACASYDNIFMVPSVNASCGTRIVASNPTGSLLYQKITGTQPASCGSPMPPSSLPMSKGLSDMDPDLVARIQTWITNGAMPPANCP